MIYIAFDISEKIKSQSLAFDFVLDYNGKPNVVEISYCFPGGPFLDDCLGFWDKNLKWNEGKYSTQYLMVEDFCKDTV
jgi:hypothetical protein